jgi:CheY-like chemotaxis protein
MRIGTLGEQPSALLADADDSLRKALEYTRSLVSELSPPVLYEFGLPMALKWLAGYMLQHGLTVTTHIESEEFSLEENQTMLVFQSVRELLMNVVKHAKTPRAEIIAARAKDCLRVTVSDRGSGFESNQLIFGASQETSSHFGLFSVRQRMQALGGDVELEAAPGQGTRATLVIPIKIKAKEKPSGISSHNPSGLSRVLSSQHVKHSIGQDSRPIRVLLADDHPMLRKGLRSVLDQYTDIEVVGEAADGEQAVTLARSLRPEIIVMDVSMPKLDGVKATTQILEEQPNIAVIGLSVHNSSQVEQSMKEAGAALFLTKELAVDRLYEAIVAAHT